MLVFNGEESYNRYCNALFGDSGISVYGYYKPQLRTLALNLATGGGTLTHELTHALVDFDFPEVPAWFNEGLASLHEQCRFRSDPRALDRGARQLAAAPVAQARRARAASPARRVIGRA